jgi:hypothetical protein
MAVICIAAGGWAQEPYTVTFGNGITAHEQVCGTNGCQWQSITSPATVYQGTSVYFYTTPQSGKGTEWYVNGTLRGTTSGNSWYMWDPSDYAEEGTIAVTMEYYDLPTYTVTFGEGITARAGEEVCGSNSCERPLITSPATVLEGTYVRFEANPPPYGKGTEWYVNGTLRGTTSGNSWYTSDYAVEGTIAVTME